MNRKYGWTPDLPDFRDHRFKMVKPAAGLPPAMNLRKDMPPVVDQGAIGSCTSQAIAGAYGFNEIAQKKPASDIFPPSRLFIYYNERVMEDSVDQDSGAAIRDGIKSLNQWGVCDEKLWPYDVSRFTDKPPANAYAAAKTQLVTKYHRLDNTNLDELKACLAGWRPFVFGFTVYESFESDQVAKTGVVPMPGKDEKVLGGHAVLCCGYKDSEQRFRVRNSWGTDWGGDGGYFTMPFAYLTDPNLADDFWTIEFVR